MTEDIDKFIEEYLELSVELHIGDTELLNYPTIHGHDLFGEEPDEYSPYEQKSYELLKLRNKVSDMRIKLINLGYNPYAMVARHTMELYKTGELKKAIDKNTGEIKSV
ncbi:MAG: hypothetical protein PWP73_226 [Methanococcus sp.]|jgi:hypothetical protein|nr:hypothetical protein [Methanococcus sp.]